MRTSSKKTSDDKVRFIFTGYLGEHKGVEVLLDAVRQLSCMTEFNGRWELSILGGGHLQKAIENTLRNLPGSPVSYLGKRPHSDIPQLFQKHDVIILPSIWPENESVALLEGIAAGMAQIATRIGGNADLVEHGKSGFLVKPGDASALLGAMIMFIKNPALADRFGRRNYVRRSRFSSSMAADGYESDYKALINRKPRRLDQSAPLVICGSGWPELASTMLVNSFNALFAKSVKSRFIPYEWASESDWQGATLFWEWTSDGNRSALRMAIDLGIPVILSHGHELAPLSKVFPSSVYPYETITQAAAIIDFLCNKFHREHRNATTEQNLLAMMMKLRDDLDTHALKAEIDIH